MGQIKFMASMVMLFIFAIAVITYSVNFANDNRVYVDMGDDAQLSTVQSNLQSDVQTFTSESNSSLQALYESSIESGDETTATGGMFKGGVLGIFGSMKTIFGFVNDKIFGGEQGNSGLGAILTIVITFMGITLALYIWKTWAGKNPE
ncbi:hypothetical protein AYK24_09880 [Thermoplasmatales archaeon SG8-52-4]|nr:MAG: hypothetical protein AYK24_09880 [Thermoplasmatales archaeon SG8-52-4]